MSTSAARLIADPLDRLTWNEICARFPQQWVVLADIAWVNETDFEFSTAMVVAHHAHRSAASSDVKAARTHTPEVGCFWTGEIRGAVPRVRS